MNFLHFLRHTMVVDHFRIHYNRLPVNGDLVKTYPWTKRFAFLPHRTVDKKWIWLRTAYYRKVWIYTGFVDEVKGQWGTLFHVVTKEKVNEDN